MREKQKFRARTRALPEHADRQAGRLVQYDSSAIGQSLYNFSLLPFSLLRHDIVDLRFPNLHRKSCYNTPYEQWNLGHVAAARNAMPLKGTWVGMAYIISGLLLILFNIFFWIKGIRCFAKETKEEPEGSAGELTPVETTEPADKEEETD